MARTASLHARARHSGAEQLGGIMVRAASPLGIPCAATRGQCTMQELEACRM
eukprot:XP_001698816.1 predicted protein [Chlamydomonas reinhardtii]